MAMIKRVLVVDDEVDITEGLVALFEIESISAQGALDRQSAEDLMASQFFPVILADFRLRTEEEGIKLIESIRVKSPKSRIATMTAYATPEVEADLQRRGSSVVLRKPLGFEDILAVVSELLHEIELEADAQTKLSGQPVDLTQLYADVQRILFSIPQRRYGLTREESEELAQEAWCLYLEKQHSVRTPRPWLAGTIVNLCRQQIHQKTRSRDISKEIGPEIEKVAGTQGSAYATQMIVRQALSRVDERTRQLCVLIGMEGFSYEEVAKSLDLPIGSVGPLYIRAKTKLRKALECGN
jgi:RNA polymerase sigma factor (sigma-70 family)